MKQEMKDREGICPLCGSQFEYDGEDITDDEGGKLPWHCPTCGATGEEGYNRTFDKHYNVVPAGGIGGEQT